MQGTRVRTISWRRKWQTTPVFLPGKSHGWRSLVDYSPWGRKDSDMTEPLDFPGSPKSLAWPTFPPWCPGNVNSTRTKIFVCCIDNFISGTPEQWVPHSLQSLSHVRHFVTPWTATHQASLPSPTEWQATSVFLPWEPHEQYEKKKKKQCLAGKESSCNAGDLG